MNFPNGMPRDQLFARMAEYHREDLDWRKGRTFAYAYDPGAEAEEVAKQAFSQFIYDNALDPTAFGGLRRFETDLLTILSTHLHGGPSCTGTYTSGGTESIFLAVRSALQHAKEQNPRLTGPQLVLPSTAHAAFHKAAAYLGVEKVVVDVDEKTLRANPQRMEEALTDRTILMVGSAPSYGHGVIDPIAELGQVAQRKGLLFHVDACVGGFLMPFWRELGEHIPDFDFKVPGVTSISIDLHKYAFAPKGVSFVFYRDASLRKKQMFASAEWVGYSLVNPAVQSSRLGGPLAAAWAVLNFFGAQGYRTIAERTLRATRELRAGIESIPELEVMGDPGFCLLGVKSTGPSVFHLVDELHARGWYVHPQLRFRNVCENLHFSVYPNHAGKIAELVEDLKASVESARSLPALEVDPSLFTQAGELTPQMLQGMLEMAGIQGTALPERMATINALLNEMPPQVRENLLTEYLNLLYMPG